MSDKKELLVWNFLVLPLLVYVWIWFIFRIQLNFLLFLLFLCLVVIANYFFLSKKNKFSKVETFIFILGAIIGLCLLGADYYFFNSNDSGWENMSYISQLGMFILLFCATIAYSHKLYKDIKFFMEREEK
jgi:hypothetical protein